MPLGFTSALDIQNRALQHCGASRILTVGEDSKQWAETNFVYDKLRRAELQRNAWVFATRKCVLRPLTATHMKIVPAAWSNATTYIPGAIVEYPSGSGNYWYSVATSNVNNTPGSSAQWDAYFGQQIADAWDTTGATSYYAGDLVYTFAGDGTYNVYMSILQGNTDNPATATTWSATTTYRKNQVVSYLSVAYISLVDLNLNQQPDTHATQWSTTIPSGVSTGSMNWVQLSGLTLTDPIYTYPVGAGPVSQIETRNVYILPAGFLKVAPQDPKAGTVEFLGAPTGLSYTDWTLENGLFTSREVQPLVFRFVADVTQVSTFHDMFCEGLACRIGLEVCESLTQSTGKINTIGISYAKFMGEARICNGIEVGAQEQPEDNYITCRM